MGIVQDTMNNELVWVFFYGSYMNADVLADAGLSPFTVGRLPSFDMNIGPLANLVRSDQHCVYGFFSG